MKLEYQLTFKEYLEASIISTKLETFSEVEFWTRAVIIVGGSIVYIIPGPNPFGVISLSVLASATSLLLQQIAGL